MCNVTAYSSGASSMLPVHHRNLDLLDGLSLDGTYFQRLQPEVHSLREISTRLQLDCVIRALQQVRIQGCFSMFCGGIKDQSILTLFGLLLLMTAKWGTYQVLGPDLEVSLYESLCAYPLAM